MLKFSNSTKNLSNFFRFKGNHKHRDYQSIPISNTTPVPTHLQISHLILDQKSPSEALETFRWASRIQNFVHDQSTYKALIQKLCAFRRFDTVHQVLDEMPSSIGSPPNDDVFVTVVRGLGNARMVRQVIKVLDLVSRFKLTPSIKVYNSILDVLVKEDIDIARGFYRRKMMSCGVEGDMYTFGILMKGLCLTNRISDAFKLIQVMKNKGVTPNIVVYNTLVHALCKNGKLGIGRARSLLMKEIAHPNDVTFNVLITAYCKEENVVQALVMLEKCFDLGFVPDVITTTKVMEVLCNKDRAMEAVEVLERVEKKGGKIDVVAYNTLIKGFCKTKKPKAARRFLNEMELKGCLPNADTYNTLISSFCELGLLDSALDMFHEMKSVGIIWNFVTYDTLIGGFCSRGKVEEGFKILEQMEEKMNGSSSHISPYNNIIYGFYKANRINEALEFLTNMGTKFPRAIDKSKQILAFTNNGNSIRNAKQVYDLMIQEGSIPSVIVYTTLIRGLCQEKMVREALEVMNDTLSRGYVPDATTLNVILKALCEEGKVGNAMKFFEDMVGRGGCLIDSRSYDVLICEVCKRGELHKCLMLVMDLVEKDYVPSYFTWNSIVHCLFRESSCFVDKKMLELILEN